MQFALIFLKVSKHYFFQGSLKKTMKKTLFSKKSFV